MYNSVARHKASLGYDICLREFEFKNKRKMTEFFCRMATFL